jgi:tRNA G18 (ribose-2'-O)-methylase SpoU
MATKLQLIGDGIENPHNAAAMVDIASSFGVACQFIDRKDLKSLEPFTQEFHALSCTTLDELKENCNSIIALDNLAGAEEIFGFKMPSSSMAAIIAGNERHGLSNEAQRSATSAVYIPMFSARLNTLNVAAASGVALYYLLRAPGGRLQSRNRPETRRPEIVLIGSNNHVELGSAIRSAGAFGWRRAIVEDRCSAWFGKDRVKVSEGRAAARSARNSIKLVNASAEKNYAFKSIIVISTVSGVPLHRANLAMGPEQVLCLPDEERVDVENENWSRFGSSVEFFKIELPAINRDNYHFRMTASIALAESSRQVGRQSAQPVGKMRKDRPVYDKAFASLLEAEGEEVLLSGLAEY